jgi:hypothetical protein
MSEDISPTFQAEFKRAVEKYPQAIWEEMHPADMHQRLLLEADELKHALWIGDFGGEHGIIIEAVHVQVMAQRIINEMSRRNL